MRINSFFGLILLLIVSSTAFGQDKTVAHLWDHSYEYPDKEIEISHMNADLVIKPYDTLVIGKVAFDFTVLRNGIDSIVFSVQDIQIEKAEIDGKAATFHLKGKDVIIFPPFELQWQNEYKILFQYRAKPKQGLNFVGWNDPKQLKRKQIWAHRPDHWLPYVSAILTVDMAVTVDDNYKVFSNGVREHVVTNKDDTKTWHYKMNHPHPFFSTCLVIGDYDFKTLKTSRGLPVELWYYPDWADHFEPAYRYQTEMFDFFEGEFGFAYPWEIYRQAPVIDYLYGAMETTTSTVYGDFLMVDSAAWYGRNYVNVNAHELAHQWFGNYISHLKTKDVWLTESFATYWAKKFEQHVFGEDYYQQVRNQELLDTHEAARKNNYGVGHARGGRARFYPKGSLVLDMLRDVMGDEEFGLVVQTYLESFPYQVAESDDFLQTIRKVTGRSMEWFFEQWVYRGGEPHYEVSFNVAFDADMKKQTRITVKQIHETNELIGLFKMPIQFEVYYQDGSRDSIVRWIKDQTEEVVIPNPENKEVDFVLFDPNRKIIKNLTFNRTYDQLVSQAMKAKNMIDRYVALLGLREFPIGKKKGDLLRIYGNENFYLTKTEIIGQLAELPAIEIIDLLVSAIHDQDDKVRLSVLRNYKSVPDVLRNDYESLLDDPSYFNVEPALENLCRSFPERCAGYLERTKTLEGWRGRNIRTKWLEIALETGQTGYLQELKDYTSESYEFETRINAMFALKHLNYLDEEVANNMLDGLVYWNYKVRNAARENLRYFYKQNKYHDLINFAILSGTWSEDEMSTFEKTFSN